MSGNLFDRLLKLIVHLIHAFRFLILRGRGDHTLLHGCASDVLSVRCVVRHRFRNDILCSLQRLLGGLYPLFLRHILAGYILLRLRQHRLSRLLQEQILRQAAQPFLLCHTRPGLSLGTVRTVEILHHNHRLRRKDLRLQFIRKLSLLLYAADHLLLFFL